MKIKSIKNYKKIKGKKVLLRVDFNVPIKNGQVVDDYRIIRSLDTINYLLDNDCRVILVSHLGKPIPGRYEERFSLKPIVKKITQILKKKIKLIDDFESLSGGNILAGMKNGEIVMLENIRYKKGETDNDKKLAKKLAGLADIYINDAFSVCHRAEASVSAIKKYLPFFAGLLLEQEVLNLNKALHPENPLIVLVGGSKIKTKIKLIKNLQKKAHKVLIGGALINNFFKVDGFNVGKSMIDAEYLDFAKKLNRDNVLLPVDVVVSAGKTGADIRVRKINEITDSDYIFDIGPETIRLYAREIKKARTIIWNGPMGFFEINIFKNGTMALAQVVGLISKKQSFTVVGGGETVEALRSLGMESGIDWVSTGGGAMLTYLGGEKMPGLDGLLV